jgi:predicted metalloprotease with PDZ domain
VRLLPSALAPLSAAIALGAAAGCATSPAPLPARSTAPAAVVWQYDVVSNRGGLDGLTIEARFAPMADDSLGVDDDAAPFVHDAAYASGAQWVSVERHGASWKVPCSTGCRVRYRYALREAATRLNDPETAIASSDAVSAPPATWLLRPDAAGGLFRFHVAIDAPWRFATPMVPVPGQPAGTFEAPTETLEDSSFAVFGAFDAETIHNGATRAEVVMAPGLAPLSRDDVIRWIRTAVDSIATYYQRPFVDRVLVVVLPGQPGNPTRGVTLGDTGPGVLVRAARGLTAAATRDDWIVTHELLHASQPSLGRGHAWLSEGMATYVEPIVRARAGLVTPERFWGDLVEGLPQGLPEAGDQGLERTHTWGRTYWGGALFCFAADLAIRERTGNARSFDDALRGVVAGGADVEAHWSIEQFLDVGDRSTGTRALHDLYRTLALAPGTVDLPGTWQRLGVKVEGGRVSFDDRAPLAAMRRSITERGPER